MTFTVLPDAASFADLLKLTAMRDPYTGPALEWTPSPKGELRVRFLYAELPEFDALAAIDAWERNHINAIRLALQNCHGHLLLVTDLLPPKAVSPDVLRYQHYSRLKHGLFDTTDYHLRDLRDYDRGSIHIPYLFAEPVLRSFPALRRPGGRPEHPAKAWYAKLGYTRNGRSLKELQRDMAQAFPALSAPSESTIRAWEKEGKSSR